MRKSNLLTLKFNAKKEIEKYIFFIITEEKINIICYMYFPLILFLWLGQPQFCIVYWPSPRMVAEPVWLHDILSSFYWVYNKIGSGVGLFHYPCTNSRLVLVSLEAAEGGIQQPTNEQQESTINLCDISEYYSISHTYDIKY